MAELLGVQLHQHLDSIIAEFKQHQTIYGYPLRKMYLGYEDVDLGVWFHGRRADTPLGPASGPQTQLAQNILLSFLGGGRIMELKTIQILDQLEIPRPCIDVRNIGFNVEWSQEISLDASYQEYVTAWVLLHILEEMELLPVPKGSRFYDTVFDLSVGYDLAGISSPRVHAWIQKMVDAQAAITTMLTNLPERYAAYRHLAVPAQIANSVTLSTFHGCPRDEIEAIVKHLIDEHGLHVIVKMNPTILGYDKVHHLLNEQLGYTHIELDPAAFEHDLSFAEGVGMMRRLQTFAEENGRTLGAKFTNTLVVKNRENIFKDEVMYLSGVPLHVLSMTAMHAFRQDMGADFHISFSAGIDQFNVVDTVACNIIPVTTCTDLLKAGGYTRMANYTANLRKAVVGYHATTLATYIQARAGVGELPTAGTVNAAKLVPTLVGNSRYHYTANSKTPPKIDSHLTLFDCLTCNKCLPVCPNGANFSLPIGVIDEAMYDYEVTATGVTAVAGNRFTLHKEAQIANLADFCNECGNCDTYCPEYGGPYIAKPRFFATAESFAHWEDRDGFYLADATTMHGRIDGETYLLALDVANQRYSWQGAHGEMVLRAGDYHYLSGQVVALAGGRVEMRPFYIMKTLLTGMMNAVDYPSILLRGLA